MFPPTMPQPCVPLPYSPAPGANRSPSFLRYYEPAKTPLRLSERSVCCVASDTLGWLSSFAPCGGIARHRKARMLLGRYHPFRRLSPRTLSGLPCSLGTPVCSCRALRPRSDLGAWLFTALRCCPRWSDDEGSNIIIISMLNHTASALAVYASCRHLWRLRKTRFRAAANLFRVGLATH